MTDGGDASYVYVLTNPAMPGMVKIGRTSADDPNYRASSLYTTGVPLPFEVAYAARVETALTVERALHNAFRDSRVNPKREFFRIEADQAIQILKLLDLEDATEEVRSELASTVAAEETAASERYKSRRPPLNFDEMGIAGETLSFERDTSISVTIIEPKKVLYNDELTALSAVTKDLLGTDYYVAPTGFWRCNGRLLSEIYDETYPTSED